MPEQISIFTCNPWESWIAQLVEENERDRKIYELEQDRQWEIDNGLWDEETNIDYVPVELLLELHST